MKNIFQKQKEVIVLILYVVLIVGLLYGVIFPMMAKINNVKDQIQEETLKQDIARQHLGQLPKLQQQYTALEQNWQLLDVLLDRDNAVVLIEKLEKLAQESGDKIKITVQDQPVAKVTGGAKSKEAAENNLAANLPSKNYLQLRISLTGDYNAVNKFIKSLESFEYYCDIIGIQIRNADVKKDSNSSAGVSSPFGLSSQATNARTSGNELDAELDVVFYTKQ